ncbi:MAG: hypothetical protein JW839_01625 [Candidatus Lokiarchaeota archaeon]|nr:hypothetical protein [Candidatus Lokiarchaeota archaeon]
MHCKKTALLAFSIVSVLSIFLASNTAAIVETKPEIKEGGLYWEYVSFGEVNPVPFTLKTAGNVSVWLLTASEFDPLLLDNGTCLAPAIAADLNTVDDGVLVNGVYTIERQWNVELLNATYGLPKATPPGEGAKPTVYFYLVLQNHGPGDQRVMVQLKPVLYFLNHLSVSTKWLQIFLNATLVIWLLWSGFTYAKSETQKNKARMYYGFGAGFGFGLAARVVGETIHYYDRDVGLYLFPQDRLEGGIAGVIFNSAATTAIPAVLLVMLLSLAFVGFSYIVEKIVKNRKPVFTVNLIIAAAATPLVLFFGEYTDYILGYVMISIILALVNVLLVYIAVARSTSGDLRKQAIYTMIGVIIPVFFQAFDAAISFGSFPGAGEIKGIVLNSVIVLGLLLFYKSNK